MSLVAGTTYLVKLESVSLELHRKDYAYRFTCALGIPGSREGAAVAFSTLLPADATAANPPGTGCMAVPANEAAGPIALSGGIIDVPCTAAGLELHVRGTRRAARDGAGETEKEKAMRRCRIRDPVCRTATLSQAL